MKKEDEMQIIGRRLLFVEDDKTLVKNYSEYFSEENVAVCVNTLEEAKKYLRFLSFDAVVLDLVLGTSDGLELFQMVDNLPPVVVCSSLSTEYDVLNALQRGAVDYVVKPCSMRLLEARLKLRLRPTNDGLLSCEGLVINPVSKVAKFYEQPVPLTASEFNVLCFLMRNSGRFFLSDQIYEQIWHAESLNTATVRKHISALRSKLEEVCAGKAFIRNEFGKGYAFIGKVVFD